MSPTGVCSKKKESRHSGSNRGPTVYKTVALPLSYVGKKEGLCPARNIAGPKRCQIIAQGASDEFEEL